MLQGGASGFKRDILITHQRDIIFKNIGDMKVGFISEGTDKLADVRRGTFGFIHDILVTDQHYIIPKTPSR